MNPEGYQNAGFYSPTSRYGTAQELMEFIDACHQNDIGIIVDFVPVHFAVDGYALANYDGTALYEYPNMDVGRSEGHLPNFMHSRGEVQAPTDLPPITGSPITMWTASAWMPSATSSTGREIRPEA